MTDSNAPTASASVVDLLPYLSQTQGVMSAFKERMELLGLQIKQLEDADAQHKAGLSSLRDDLRVTTKELGDFVGTLNTIHDVVLSGGPNHPSLKELTFHLQKQVENQEARVKQYEDQQKKDMQAEVNKHEEAADDRSKFWRSTIAGILLVVLSSTLAFIIAKLTK